MPKIFKLWHSWGADLTWFISIEFIIFSNFSEASFSLSCYQFRLCSPQQPQTRIRYKIQACPEFPRQPVWTSWLQLPTYFFCYCLIDKSNLFSHYIYCLNSYVNYWIASVIMLTQGEFANIIYCIYEPPRSVLLCPFPADQLQEHSLSRIGLLLAAESFLTNIYPYFRNDWLLGCSNIKKKNIFDICNFGNFLQKTLHTVWKLNAFCRLCECSYLLKLFWRKDISPVYIISI